MDSTIKDLMKPEFRSAGNGLSEIGFVARDEFRIPSGVVQGGIVAVMLDMAMATAAEGALATASLNFDILRPVVANELTVKGKIVRKGRRIVFAEAEMTDGDGVLLARGTQTAVPLP